jgi:hypothetical protein
MAGRKPKWNEQFIQQARIACEKLGATDSDLAKLFSVTVKTLNLWKHSKPGFVEAIHQGKEIFDCRIVEESLLKRATGYEIPWEETHVRSKNGIKETTVKKGVTHISPDTTAAIFFLKNRHPDRWRDKQDVELSGGAEIHFGVTKNYGGDRAKD